MEIVDTYELYLKRRLEGEDVLPSAYVYGLAASNLTNGPFAVLDLNDDYFSLYTYIRDCNGRFAVTGFSERVSHGLHDVINDKMKVATTRWWNIVFYESDGICQYDLYYDNLPIADGCKMTFGELLSRLKDTIVQMMPNDFATGNLFLAGSWIDCRPLRWLFQQQYGARFAILPQIELSKPESDAVVRPEKELSDNVLKVTGGVSVNALAEQSLLVTYPVSCSDEVAFGEMGWSSLIPSDKPEYTINVGGEDVAFKRLLIGADYDVFGNVFLSCSDSYGNSRICRLEPTE